MPTTNPPKFTATSRMAAAALGAALVATSASFATAGAATVRPHSSVTLELYSAQGYDSYVVNAFNKANPGINVVLTDGSTGPLLTKIAAEQASHSPKWNLMWADGSTWAAAFDTSGWSQKSIIPKGTAYDAMGLANKPADGAFAPTGVTVTGGLCYDKVAVANNHVALPTTWAGLTKVPKGSLGMNNPSFSGPTFPLIASVMAHLGGISSTKNPTAAQVKTAIAKGEAFFQTLKNNGLQVHHTNGPTLGAMESNPATLDMATIQTSACYGDIAGGYWPSGAVKYLDYSAELPSSIAISKDVSKAQLAAAEKFVAFVLSVNGQQTMQKGDPTGDGLFWPVISKVTPESGVPAFSSTKAFAINPYVWGPQQNGIDTWFTNNIA